MADFLPAVPTYGNATPSNLDLGVDNAAMTGGSGGSIWEDAGNLVTKAAPLVARSVYLSFKNMPYDVGNWFGMQNKLETMEESLGPDADAADARAYYAAHSQGIDAAGLIVGSFLPGLATSKLLSAGKIVGALKAGAQAEEISSAMGLLPSVRRAQVLADATTAITTNASAYTAIAADTMKASIWGIADQALQAAAWETATIATMHSNPALNNDGLVDSIDHIFWGGVTGGLFATPFTVLGARTTLRAVQSKMEIVEKGQEVLTKMGAGQYLVGDKVAQTIASVWDHEAMNAPANISEGNKAAGRAMSVKLDAIQQMNKVSEDPDVSNALFDFVYAAKQKGMPLIGSGNDLGILDHLTGTKGIYRVNNPEFLTADSDVFFLNSHNKNTCVPEWEGTPTNPANWMTKDFDPTAKGAGSQSSRRVKFADGFDQSQFYRGAFGDPLQMESGNFAKTAADAWEAGMHVWTDELGKLHVNPDKSLIGPQGSVLRTLPMDTQLDPVLVKYFKANGKLPEDLNIINQQQTQLTTDMDKIDSSQRFRQGLIQKSDGTTVGDYSIRETPDAVHMRTVGINSEAQGKGYGLSAYRHVIDEAQASGKPFISDTSVSPEAQKVYDRLAALGYKVEKNPAAKLEEDGTLTTKGWGIYKVTGSPRMKAMEPIKSASYVLNVRTGDVAKDCWPSIGDIASAKLDATTGRPLSNSPVKLVNGGDGLEVNGQVFNYGLDTKYDPLTAANLEANGRFAWAKLRGLRQGDTIAADDLPVLEAAVYQLRGKTQKEVADMKLALEGYDSESSGFFPSTDALQQHVLDLKASIFKDLTEAGQPQRDAADLATRVNTPVDWIAAGGAPADFSLSSIDPAEHLGISHVRVNFDTSVAGSDADGNVARGMQAVQYRIDNAKAIAQNAAAAGLGDAAGDILIQDASKYNSTQALQTKTSATAFSHADADSSTLANRLQFAGRRLLDFISDRIDESQSFMQPHYHSLLADPEASATLAALRNAHLRMGEKFKFMDVEGNPSLKAQVEGILGRTLAEGEDVLVPSKSLTTDEMRNAVWDPKYKPKAADNPTDAAKWVSAHDLGRMGGDASVLTEGDARALGLYAVPPKVAAFLKAQVVVNDQRLALQNNLNSAVGNPRNWEMGNVYFPPVNVRNYPHVAWVKQKEGLGGGTDSTAAILGFSEADLKNKIAQVQASHPELDVFTKGQTKEYFKARGDYDFNVNLVDNEVNTTLHREGKLVDFIPNMRGETTLADYAEWNKNQTTRLYRNHAEVGNGQLYSELNMMGKQWDWIAQSKIGKASDDAATKAMDNPYQNLMYQGLGINPRVGYILWNKAQDQAESLFSTAFTKARQAFGDASSGLIDFQKANDICKSYGLGNAYGDTLTALQTYRLAAGIAPSPMLEKFVRVANSVQTAMAIRLDAVQGLINTISTPILMWPEALAAARKVGVTELPGVNGADGSAVNVLTLSKLMAQSIAKWHSDAPADVLFKQQLVDKGFLRMNPTKYFDLMNDLTLRGNETQSILAAKISGAVDKTANLIGTNFSEQFGRYMAADVAKQIFEAAGQTGEELWANINTFTSRVHGCQVAAQRPIAFQGPIGAAIGLFQTYQFNFMQNVFRYVGEGDYKALALMTGLQSTLYGMQGLPGFNFINQHIIGNAMNNPAHSDIYSGTKSLLGNSLGDLAMYGSASTLLGTGLYTRGDVNPRSLTVLPVNPADIPTVSTGIRFMQNMYQVTKKMADGDSFWDTFTQGLEHNGISRPISGLGQLLQGYSTTSEGALISANPKSPANTGAVTDIFNIMNFARLAGARPLDEAVIMDATFRRTAYQAADTSRMEALGSAVKDSLRKGETPTDSQMQTFVSKYAAAGGYPANFGKQMVEWTKDANTSVANEVYRKLQTPAVRNQQLVMGGKMLPDYSMAPIGGVPQQASTNPGGVGSTQGANISGIAGIQ